MNANANKKLVVCFTFSVVTVVFCSSIFSTREEKRIYFDIQEKSKKE